MPKQTIQQHRLKIIGGKWRSRVFSFPKIGTIRPTPNRVRETLFNWLNSVILESHCLDLFAGSGALGFEALSRGAASVTFVDREPAIIKHLKDTAAYLHAENVSIFRLDVPLETCPFKNPFNLVFLDPPFLSNLIAPCCTWLEAQGLLAENAYVYIEAEKNLDPLPVPATWELLKSKIAGQVGYHLFRVC